MPIYAYTCTACGHELEVLQKISEPALTQCPECNRNEPRKQLTAPVFRLKGGGWYETDFKKDGKRNLADSGDAGSKDSGKSGDSSATKSDSGSTKSESKPASGSSTDRATSVATGS